MMVLGVSLLCPPFFGLGRIVALTVGLEIACSSLGGLQRVYSRAARGDVFYVKLDVEEW